MSRVVEEAIAYVVLAEVTPASGCCAEKQASRQATPGGVLALGGVP